MKKTITRNEARALYPTLTALAEALEASRTAIYFWPEDDDIPEWAYLKLRFVLKPEAFTSAGKLKKRKK